MIRAEYNPSVVRKLDLGFDYWPMSPTLMTCQTLLDRGDDSSEQDPRAN